MCMIDDSDGPCTVLHSRSQRARLQHQCTECRRAIQPGEQYLCERTVFDGQAHTHKLCAHCQEVREYLRLHCGGWLYGGLLEDMSDHYSGDTCNFALSRAVRLLAIGIQSRWTRSDGSLWPVPISDHQRGERANTKGGQP